MGTEKRMSISAANSFAAGEQSLVLYHGQAARVVRVAEKLEIEEATGELTRVRLKDVALLHPGPLRSLAELKPVTGEVQTAWEMLAGSTTTLREIAELAYGAFTPQSAWATWLLVADGLFFRGTPDAITVCSSSEVEARQAARAADAAEKRAWAAFLEHARAGRLAAEDERYAREIEALAFNRTTTSRALKELGHAETPENAHACLLELQHWTPSVNPYPRRLGLDLTPPAGEVPLLPDEPRLNLTDLLALAIDDASTDTPDDAVSLDVSGRIWVHVADPAAVIGPDSPLDLDARARGSSLYLPERVTPMLPLTATPRFGLGLSDVSPALSFGITLDAAGHIVDLTIAPSWVRVSRVTYEEATSRLYESPLAELHQLALAYRQGRMQNGAVDLHLPEVDVVVDAGQVVLRPVPDQPSRVLVENAMVMAGEAVAAYAITHGIPMPYSTQEIMGEPEGESGPADSLAAAYAKRRTLKRSEYSSLPGPHAALGLKAYSQVTSPMRRYLDLVAHQQIRSHLGRGRILSQEEIVERVGALEAVGGAVRQAESLSNQHWTLVYLLEHPSWQGEGVLVAKRNQNGTFLTPELGLEPQVHLAEDLPLNTRVMLRLRGVDLPRLDARFKIDRTE